MERPEHLKTLTSVRFFAALWVVVYHWGHHWPGGLPNEGLGGLVGAFARNGAQGVSLFYVLSGFILTWTHPDAASDWSARSRLKFWRARFARIYPMYVVGLLLGAPRLWLALDHPSVAWARAHPWANIATHLTLTQIYPQIPLGALNGPLWSVACEAGFYALFPFLLPLVSRISTRRLLAAGVLIFAASAILPLAYSSFAFPQLAGRLGYPYTGATDLSIVLAVTMWPVFRLGEFLLGILVCRAVREVEWTPRARSILAAALAASAAVFIGTAFRTWAAHDALLAVQVLPVPCFAVAVLWAALRRGSRPKWLAHSALVRLGEASYSLYVIHVPLMQMTLIAARRVPGVPFWLVELLGIAGAVGLSLGFWRFVEVPARKAILRRRPNAGVPA